MLVQLRVRVQHLYICICTCIHTPTRLSHGGNNSSGEDHDSDNCTYHHHQRRRYRRQPKSYGKNGEGQGTRFLVCCYWNSFDSRSLCFPVNSFTNSNIIVIVVVLSQSVRYQYQSVLEGQPSLLAGLDISTRGTDHLHVPLGLSPNLSSSMNRNAK